MSYRMVVNATLQCTRDHKFVCGDLQLSVQLK